MFPSWRLASLSIKSPLFLEPFCILLMLSQIPFLIGRQRYRFVGGEDQFHLSLDEYLSYRMPSVLDFLVGEGIHGADNVIEKRALKLDSLGELLSVLQVLAT